MVNRVRELLERNDFENVVIFDDDKFCDAFVGVTTDNRAVYDYYKMLDCICSEGIPEDCCEDYLYYNILCYSESADMRLPIVLKILGE